MQIIYNMSTDILLMKDLVKNIDVAIQRLESRAKSCDTRGTITDFEEIHDYIKKTGPMISDMRIKDSENKEILEMAQNFSSLNNRYFNAKFEFENECICSKKKK